MKPEMVIRFFIVAIGLALLVPAPVALMAPGLAASAFGIPVPTVEAQAYLLAIGIRDVALGVWLLSMLALGAAPRLLAASLWSISIVAAGDALNVGTYSQWQNFQALVPHVAGIVVLVAIGWRLWRRAQ